MSCRVPRRAGEEFRPSRPPSARQGSPQANRPHNPPLSDHPVGNVIAESLDLKVVGRGHFIALESAIVLGTEGATQAIVKPFRSLQLVCG
jgi:hypothetical protein